LTFLSDDAPGSHNANGPRNGSAQMETRFILERQRERIAKAKERGGTPAAKGDLIMLKLSA